MQGWWGSKIVLSTLYTYALVISSVSSGFTTILADCKAGVGNVFYEEGHFRSFKFFDVMAVTISFGEAYDVSWFWWYCYSRRQGQTKWFLGPYMDLSFLVPDLEGTLKLRVIELKKQQHIAIVTKKKFKKKNTE